MDFRLFHSKMNKFCLNIRLNKVRNTVVIWKAKYTFQKLLIAHITSKSNVSKHIICHINNEFQFFLKRVLTDCLKYINQ